MRQYYQSFPNPFQSLVLGFLSFSLLPFSLSDLICFLGFIYTLYTSDTQICMSSLKLSPELWASRW